MGNLDYYHYTLTINLYRVSPVMLGLCDLSFPEVQSYPKIVLRVAQYAVQYIRKYSD